MTTPHFPFRLNARSVASRRFRSRTCMRVAGRLAERVETRKDSVTGRGHRVDKAARVRAMKEQWDASIGAFRCKYTRTPLSAEYGSRTGVLTVSPRTESSWSCPQIPEA